MPAEWSAKRACGDPRCDVDLDLTVGELCAHQALAPGHAREDGWGPGFAACAPDLIAGREVATRQLVTRILFLAQQVVEVSDLER
jgi:hypothetical protein